MRATDAPRVVVIGDALIDELRDADGAREFVGGAGLNVAVGLAILGIDAELIAMIGDDDDGLRIRAHLATHGVTLLETIGPLGTARAVSERVAGEPVYTFNEAAHARRIAFDARQRAALDDADLVVVSSFPFDDAAQLGALLSSVDRPADRLVIDPNPRAPLLTDPAAFADGFEDLATRCLLVKLSDEDAELLFRQSLDVARSRLLHDGASAVLATAGRNGAALATASGILVDEGIVELPGDIIDTMGAGDATLASVASALAAGDVPDTVVGASRILRDAMGVAAATCRRQGAVLRLPAQA